MICVIPARAGSQRIPGKNIKDFHGKPILAYSIELAKESGLFERIIVSTDGPEIAAVAEEYGAEVHQRPPELARDEIGTQEVVGAVLEDLGVADTSDVCALYPTCPLMGATELEMAGLSFRIDRDYNFLYSVESPKYIDPDIRPSGGFYFGSAYLFKAGIDPYELGNAWVTNDIDINTPEDWERAEKLYEERNNGTSGPLVE